MAVFFCNRQNEVMEKMVGKIIGLAKQAAKMGEVPVGAVVVDSTGVVIGQGRNKTHATRDGLQHAEIIAIKKAQKHIGDWRLEGCSLYVTLEPCLMCLGAIGNARISRVGYLLADPMFGSVESKLNPSQVKQMFPNLEVVKLSGGEIVESLMKEFFAQLRQRDKQARMGNDM